jgi:hypothetical protein
MSLAAPRIGTALLNCLARRRALIVLRPVLPGMRNIMPVALVRLNQPSPSTPPAGIEALRASW